MVGADVGTSSHTLHRKLERMRGARLAPSLKNHRRGQASTIKGITEDMPPYPMT
jgi:hypothetical protein